MDRILIDGLSAHCILGVGAEERREPQEVIISLVLWADLGPAGASDRIEDTVDYRAVKKQILRMAEQSEFQLVESLAAAVADIALAQPLVKRVRVRVDKPTALRFARSVGVEITRVQKPLASALIGLGSNIRPAENIRRALRLLAQQTRLQGFSTVYANEALGRPGQAKFYNCAARVLTPASAPVLKQSVLAYIETELGRVRNHDKYADRTIDLDLLVYPDLHVNTPGLALPDPQIAERPFLAVPLAELAPDLILPGQGRSLKEIAAGLGSQTLEPLLEYTRTLRSELRHEPESGKNAKIGAGTFA